MSGALHVLYRVTSDPHAIEARARALAVEQSVEMPVAAIDDAHVLSEIVGKVEAIAPLDAGHYEVRIRLAAETVGDDPGQLLNMLFGNSSLHDDVILHDVEFPAALAAAFGGPRHGLAELRRRTGAPLRALTCSALKPQGLPPDRLADLAARLARGGLDYVKDDHGLADQASAPFAARVNAVTQALRDVAQATGRLTHYVPSLSGPLDSMRRQIAAARGAGLCGVLVAPMIAGLSNVLALGREHPDIAFFAHPAMAGARIAPHLVLGKIFRMIGADAIVFPNHGGRFGYSPDMCRRLAETARGRWGDLAPSLPVPAGGMRRERIAEMLDFYGRDVMLLIGGDLLIARDRLSEAAAGFVAEVQGYSYG